MPVSITNLREFNKTEFYFSAACSFLSFQLDAPLVSKAICN